MAIQSRPITYWHGATELEGFLAWDDAWSGPRPAVAISHTWGGRSEFEDQKALKLAEQGYVGFAIDMYGKGILGKDPQENTALMGPFMQDRAFLQARIAQGIATLRQQSEVDASNVAAMGFCFGGLCVLDLARSGSEVRGVVSFHGSLDTPMPVSEGDIVAKLLVCHGAVDPYVKPEAVHGFLEEMEAAGVDYQLIMYAGAVHAFTQKGAGDDPSKGAAYNEAADHRSWQAMQDFFNEIFE
jgi:dienelactone hydrolase